MTLTSTALWVVAATSLGGMARQMVSATADTACVVMNTETLPLALRESPLDSVTFRIGGAPVKICYGRPSAGGRRPVIGGSIVPYGQLWRTGDNEPTMIHTTIPLVVAGIRIPAGSYSLYTIPHPGQWNVIVNRSTAQWGDESLYTGAVRAQEQGRAPVSAERSEQYVDRLTIRIEQVSPNIAIILLEWGHTQVEIPVLKG